MPPLEEMDLPHTAVYLRKTGVDKHNEPAVAAPVEIAVRWNGKRTQTIDREASPLALDATVITADTIVEGSLMWKGELVDWNEALGNELMEVMTVTTTSSLNGRFQRIELGLRKFRKRV